jgi:hypothetical protein
MAQVLQYVDDFRPTELDVVATGDSGTAVVAATAADAASR